MELRIERQESTADDCVFTKEQNEIKQKIVDNLIRTFFDGVPDDDTFSPMSALNLFTSVIVIFNSGMIIHTIKTFGLENLRKYFMDSIFDEISKEVDATIKEGMM